MHQTKTTGVPLLWHPVYTCNTRIRPRHSYQHNAQWGYWCSVI